MAEKNQEKSKEIIMTAIGAIALGLVFLIGGGWGSSDIGFFKSAAPYALWLGIGLLVFYQFMFVTNSYIARALKGEFASQAALAVLMTYCLLSSSVEAAAALNRVFSVDASAFPNALRIMTFVHMFLMGKPLFWMFFVWSVVAFSYFFFADQEDASMSTWIFSVSGIVISGVALMFIYHNFEEGQLDRRAYLIARTADFYSKANCPGVKITGAVVFLGPEQRRVLVDATADPKLSLTQALTAKNDDFVKVEQPSSFSIYLCRENTP